MFQAHQLQQRLGQAADLAALLQGDPEVAPAFLGAQGRVLEDRVSR